MTRQAEPKARLHSRAATMDVEVLIVGAGISGIGAGIELARRGFQSFALLEAAATLGGTWRDNTYPGAAVDIPVSSYCFAFESGYPWSRQFAPGREILDYLRHCATQYGIDRRIRYKARVTRAQFNADTDQWLTELSDGRMLRSRYLIAATGLFGPVKLPDIPGLETFAGKTMHSARWDHSYDLAGRRVALIGTGASAVQIIPTIAPAVAHLDVFQRTAIWISPRLDRALKTDVVLAPRRLAMVRVLLRFLSEFNLEVLTYSIVNYRTRPLMVRTIQACLRYSMRRQLDDPAVAANLIPSYRLGCKRPATSNTYLPAFNLPQVSLVSDPIARICREGVVTRSGQLHPADTLLLATGFMTTERGNAPAFQVIGTGGVELGQFWQAQRRQAYAGVAVAGFPNFFLTAGPYSGGFNWFTMLQAQLKQILQCMERARTLGATRLEVNRDAQDRYMQHIWRRAEGTVFKDASCQSAQSYYLDSHGDASLPLPHTPWWRVLRDFRTKTRDYQFSSGGDR